MKIESNIFKYKQYRAIVEPAIVVHHVKSAIEVSM